VFEKELEPLIRQDRLRVERMLEVANRDILSALAEPVIDVNKIMLKCATLSSVFKFAALLRQETAPKG
jgi:hypothetical protein